MINKIELARHRETFQMLRLLRGLSHAEAARKTGVSASTIAKWRWPVSQGGIKLPRYDTMSRVLNAFGFHFVKMPIDKMANSTWEDTVDTKMKALNLIEPKATKKKGKKK